jgi:hypothetical protein
MFYPSIAEERDEEPLDQKRFFYLAENGVLLISTFSNLRAGVLVITKKSVSENQIAKAVMEGTIYHSINVRPHLVRPYNNPAVEVLSGDDIYYNSFVQYKKDKKDRKKKDRKK